MKRGSYGVLDSGDPWLLLALAILSQAVDDAREGDEEANGWLLEVAPAWVEVIDDDIRVEMFVSWVRSGCPKIINFQRRVRAYSWSEWIGKRSIGKNGEAL